MTLFFDTETTGKAEFRLPPEHPSQPHIVQLAAMLVDAAGEVAGEMNLIVRPDGWTISDEVSKIHGITQAHADKYGFRLRDVMELFRLMCGRAETIVAHNIDFDALMVRASFSRITGPGAQIADFECAKKFCTMQKSTALCKLPGNYGKYKWPKLQEAHVHFFGREFDGAHDAMADVRACRDVYYAMQKKEDAP